MTLAIIGLVSTVLGFVLWAVRRNMERNDTPQARFEKRQEAIDTAIAHGNADELNVLLLGIDRLPYRQSDPSGQSGGTDAGAEAVHAKP